MESEKRETEVAMAGLMTPLEHQLLGGTAEEEDFPFDVPLGISLGYYTLEQIRQARAVKRFITTTIIAEAFGYPMPLAISLEEMDPQTGKVQNLPRFLGFWNSKEDKIIEQEGLNEEVWNKVRQRKLVEEK